MNLVQFIPQGLDVVKEQVASLAQKWRLSKVELFGSITRDDFNPDLSDVDLLITYRADSKISLFTLPQLQAEFEKIFNRKVDLVSRMAIERSSNYLRRESILSHTVTLYEE